MNFKNKLQQCSRYGKQYGVASKNLEIELPHDIPIPHLGIYPGKTKPLSQRNTCTHVQCSIINNSQGMETS